MLGIGLSAQNGFFINPDSVSGNFMNVDISDISDNWIYVDLEIFLENNSDNTIQFGWKREFDADCPMVWETLISDKFLDYPPSVSISPIATEIMPDEEDFLYRVHILPKGQTGCCEVRIIFSEYDTPEIPIDTAHFYFQINEEDCMTTGIEVVQAPENTIFPNPVSETFQLQNVGHVEEIKLFDMSGSLVLEMADLQSPEVNIGDLPSGVYWLYMSNEEGIRFSQRLIKL